MSTLLAQRLADYLAMRRGLGFKLRAHDHWLRQFVAYVNQTGATAITIEAAVTWATKPAGAPGWAASRLSMVRGFARHMVSLDPATEIPPADLLPCPRQRATPFIYSEDDIAALMSLASERTATPLSAATFRALIGLLAVTGMRLGEAINLDRDDLDPDEGVLVVRQGKFGKSRELALHPSTLAALENYAALRRQHYRQPRSAALLVSNAGTRLHHQNVQNRFHRIAQAAGLTPRSPTCRPRIHDLRHTFAVTTLLSWYRAGVDVQARLPLLSTYLGHVDPSSTYWYLTATPELMQLVAQRLDPAGRA